MHQSNCNFFKIISPLNIWIYAHPAHIVEQWRNFITFITMHTIRIKFIFEHWLNSDDWWRVKVQRVVKHVYEVYFIGVCVCLKSVTGVYSLILTDGSFGVSPSVNQSDQSEHQRRSFQCFWFPTFFKIPSFMLHKRCERL